MTHRVALIPGDGIGLEVVPEGVRVLKALSAQFAFKMEFNEFPYSCRHYVEHGVMMPEDGIERLRPFDAILLGAVGAPNMPDHVSLWGLLIPIRRGFDQYVNMRPVRLLPGVRSPLAGRTAGRHRFRDRAREHRGRVLRGRRPAVSRAPSTRWRSRRASSPGAGVDRIVRYAFELARSRGRAST